MENTEKICSILISLKDASGNSLLPEGMPLKLAAPIILNKFIADNQKSIQVILNTYHVQGILINCFVRQDSMVIKYGAENVISKEDKEKIAECLMSLMENDGLECLDISIGNEEKDFEDESAFVSEQKDNTAPFSQFKKTKKLETADKSYLLNGKLEELTELRDKLLSKFTENSSKEEAARLKELSKEINEIKVKLELL